MPDEFEQLLADVARADFERNRAAWAALAKYLSETRAAIGLALERINAEDSIGARVQTDEALAHLAVLVQWREAVT